MFGVLGPNVEGRERQAGSRGAGMSKIERRLGETIIRSVQDKTRQDNEANCEASRNVISSR